jgi:hypothetical protein
MLWKGNLTDIKKFSSGGADLYIRLAYTELGKRFIFYPILVYNVACKPFPVTENY